jgi:hypothetical protein
MMEGDDFDSDDDDDAWDMGGMTGIRCFKMTSHVVPGGCRVRREMSVSSDHVGTIAKSKINERHLVEKDVILISKVCGDWLKLAPVMMNGVLRNSYNFQEFDVETQGYVARRHDGRTFFVEQVCH